MHHRALSSLMSRHVLRVSKHLIKYNYCITHHKGQSRLPPAKCCSAVQEVKLAAARQQNQLPKTHFTDGLAQPSNLQRNYSTWCVEMIPPAWLRWQAACRLQRQLQHQLLHCSCPHEPCHQICSPHQQPSKPPELQTSVKNAGLQQP